MTKAEAPELTKRPLERLLSKTKETSKPKEVPKLKPKKVEDTAKTVKPEQGKPAADKKPKQIAMVKKPEAAPAKTASDLQRVRLNGILNVYRANMLRLTYRHVVYPSRSLNLNQEGTVVLKVTVNRKGKVMDIKQEERSQYVALNKAAEKAVKKANPYPAIPKQLTGNKFEFKIPIKFRIPS